MSFSGAIISLTAVNWDFPLIGRTRMLTEAWHSAGQNALFIEPPHSYRSLLAEWKDRLKRSPRRLTHVIRPWPLRYPARWWTRMDDTRLRKMMRDRAESLRRTLDKRCTRSESAAIVVSPIWLPWLTALGVGRLIYDCIDDLSVHAPDPAKLQLYQKWEAELINRADAVVVTAENLRTHVLARRPDARIGMIRNGVDVDRFTRIADQSPRPADLPERGRPTIGFVGALYEWIDFELIRSAAAALPDADFVFIGPDNQPDQLSDLRRLPNVKCLGARPYDEVPAYIRAFDLCWVPFKTGPIASAANPVKIYEYLSLGKPVITTPVADTDSFGPHVRLGNSIDATILHLREALASISDDDAAASRVEFARRNSWRARADQYVDFISSLPEK